MVVERVLTSAGSTPTGMRVIVQQIFGVWLGAVWSEGIPKASV